MLDSSTLLTNEIYRDRELNLWDLDTGVNLAKQANAHARGITSVKLMGHRAVSSSKDKVRKTVKTIILKQPEVDQEHV